jgi:hypothetical protein
MLNFIEEGGIFNHFFVSKIDQGNLITDNE